MYGHMTCPEPFLSVQVHFVVLRVRDLDLRLLLHYGLDDHCHR